MTAVAPASSLAWLRRGRTGIELALLAALAYLPTLFAARGVVPADTKLYLYLDPARLISDAPFTWDTRQFAGWVPHQNVGYLWPSGPWFWCFEQLGVPDWIAHRLWIGTILFVAGAGVRWCARVLGLGPGAALTAAVVYQLSPYVLPYISRTSVLLPPWAGLGWLVGLTALAARGRLLPHLAATGLLIATIGGINATAMAMIAPAPILWLVDAAARREITWRRAVGVAAAIAAVSLATSLWWLAGLRVQGAYGANALVYSETLESTSHTSSAPEVLRGLGYWLFYVRDQVTPLTSASDAYQLSGRVVLAGWSLVVLGAAGIGVVAWRARRFAAWTALAGLLLAVGVHPFDDPSPLGALLTERSRETVVLALRSSTRAAPLVVLGLALGAGVLAAAAASRLRTVRWAPFAAVGVLAVVNLPALWTGAYVDPALARPDPLPTPWLDVAAHLDTTGPGRVLLLPGMESAAYRWGYTVDPPLPGLTTKPLVTRDWLPLGSPAAMDLLYALDDRFQSGIAEEAAIAPVARLLGADTVMVANDVQFERFPTVRPEPVWERYQDGVAGLGPWRAFGEPVANVPVVPMVDEEALLHPSTGTPLPPVAVAAVDDAPGIGRAGAHAVVVSGSGDGVVDASAAGLIDGREVLVYSGSLQGEELARAVAAAPVVVVTDSNRERAHHWRSSQEVWGFTESGSADAPTALLERDPFDHRLPVFVDAVPEARTVAQQRGVVARASSYGAPNSYWPEARPALAVDGDPTTAWFVADRDDPTGERLHLTAPAAARSITVLQPPAGPAGRWITRLGLTSADGSVDLDVELDESSRTAPGQTITLPVPTSELELRIEEVTAPSLLERYGWGRVGFAEVDLGAGPTDEVTRLPSDALAVLPADTPLAVVMTRLRHDPTDRWRDDPERSMVRELVLAQERALTPELTVRLSPRATDAVLAELAGAPLPVASARLAGSAAVGAPAAFDGDPETAWVTPFAVGPGSSLVAPLDGSPVDSLEVLVRTDVGYARPTELVVEAGGERRVVALDPAATGAQVVEFEAVRGNELRLTVSATDGADTVDRRTNLPTALPVGLAEVRVPGQEVASWPEWLDTGCRDDLVTVDGEPVTVQVTGRWEELLAGAPATVTLCGPPALRLGAGEHVVRTASGVATGLDVDRIVLTDAVDRPERPAAIEVQRSAGRTTRTFQVGPCPEGCWLVQGEGWSTGWEGTVDGEPLGRPSVVDGGMSGWWLPPADAGRTVRLTWAPQRSVWLAFVLSGLAVLACAAVVVASLVRRRRGAATSLGHEPDPAGGWPGPPSWAAVAVGAVVGILLVSPPAGLAATAVLALGAATRRWWIAPTVAVGVLVVVGATVLHGVLVDRVPIGFDWPLGFTSVHRPALVAVVVLAAATLERGAARPRPAE